MTTITTATMTLPTSKISTQPPASKGTPGLLSTAHATHTTQSNANTRISYLFGNPIAYSLSPLIHYPVFEALNLNWGYYLHESTSIPSFLALTKDPKFFGSAVTMPHKVAIIPHLDELTPEGKAIGAVNTIFLKSSQEGKRLLCGTNTDCVGVREALRRSMSPKQSTECRGRPGLIVGGGGTCRAAVYALKEWIGCSEIYIINRDKSEVDAVIAECTASGFGDNLIHITDDKLAASLPKPAVMVSAVPNFPPKTKEEIMARRCLEIMFDGVQDKEEKNVILEMCYAPTPDTEIAQLAREKGWKVVEGTEAMVWQGLEQCRLWTGKRVEDMPVARVKALIQEALENRRLERAVN